MISLNQEHRLLVGILTSFLVHMKSMVVDLSVQQRRLGGQSFLSFYFFFRMRTVFSMDSGSAAGPDGYTEAFFYFCMVNSRGGFIEGGAEFFCGAELPKSITSALIVLTPKVEQPQDSFHNSVL